MGTRFKTVSKNREQIIMLERLHVWYNERQISPSLPASADGKVVMKNE